MHMPEMHTCTALHGLLLLNHASGPGESSMLRLTSLSTWGDIVGRGYRYRVMQSLWSKPGAASASPLTASENTARSPTTVRVTSLELSEVGCSRPAYSRTMLHGCVTWSSAADRPHTTKLHNHPTPPLPLSPCCAASTFFAENKKEKEKKKDTYNACCLSYEDTPSRRLQQVRERGDVTSSRRRRPSLRRVSRARTGDS